MKNGWFTSDGKGGKAHFYRDDKPVCGDRKGIWPGGTIGELFTRPTRQPAPGDHFCRWCAKVEPKECTCWDCHQAALNERLTQSYRETKEQAKRDRKALRVSGGARR